LPQLLNVLKGDMSLVGPRPEQPRFVEEFRGSIPRYMLRHHVKAGITGWAQVNGLRGDTPLDQRIEYDLYYIRNWSLLFDVRIILLTLVRVFRDASAH
jgi:lipopolysaccharide/colanic/teichoic acid biosynthesis glycosyltransferase